MKYMGIDVGSKRIGIAFSDDSGAVAFPHGTVLVTPAVLDTLKSSATEAGVTHIVIGHSMNRDNEPNAILSFAQEIGEYLKEHFTVLFEWEGYTSAHARRLHTFRDGQPRGVLSRKEKKKKQQHVDDAAAALILQAYLDGKVIAPSA
jgi:putative holliday junction resolvase